MNRREMLQVWIRAVLLDSRTDLEDKIALGDRLEELGVLPPETWMAVDTYRLDDAQTHELVAAVRAVIDRNPISEAFRNWELVHGLTFGGESTDRRTP